MGERAFGSIDKTKFEKLIKKVDKATFRTLLTEQSMGDSFPRTYLDSMEVFTSYLYSPEEEFLDPEFHEQFLEFCMRVKRLLDDILSEDYGLDERVDPKRDFISLKRHPERLKVAKRLNEEACEIWERYTDIIRLARRKTFFLIDGTGIEFSLFDDNMISDADIERLWGVNSSFLRIFLSHDSKFKEFAGSLKRSFASYNVSCFVAHDDVEPTKPWQDEIEKALFSMDVLIPILTQDFSNSQWTGQEIGIAIGRGTSIVSVKCGSNPPGFIGKFQAVNGTKRESDEIASNVFSIILRDMRIGSKCLESLICQLESSGSWVKSEWCVNKLAAVKDILTVDQKKRLQKAYSDNSQVGHSYAVQGILPSIVGKIN
jgi:hypothetical protein